MLAQFLGPVRKIYPLIAAYIRTFLCEVDWILPLLAVREADGDGSSLLSLVRILRSSTKWYRCERLSMVIIIESGDTTGVVWIGKRTAKTTGRDTTAFHLRRNR